ncbi:glycosyltransferase [Echinicola salinicaeni]|uniref:glycosyltransferase n=1 Tax=Echinicola salinicaeni TaxID=2762757 RepID=UPI0016445C34|nr:glycosyltransferase [Echinicola salinicaeni]
MDMNLLVFFFFGVLAVYSAILLLLVYYWGKDKPSDTGVDQAFEYPVSLVIPFRNEINNLPKLLSNLAKQEYANLQVVLVDDHSEDGGEEFVKEWLKSKGHDNFLLIQSQGEGKKAALERGVAVSNGLIVLTSDADCKLPAQWVKDMVKPFDDPNIQMVAGPVMSKGGKTMFENFQQIEWGSVLLMTKFFIQIGRPVMCSGANMGYRKAAFLHLRGYQGNRDYASGDDSFLLEKMSKRFGADAIKYLSGKEVLVRTKARQNWKKLLFQRARWAKKWNKHQNWENAAGAIISALFTVFSILTVFLLFGGGLIPLLFLLYWSIKVLVEYWSLNKVLKDYEIKLPFLSFMYTSFFHPLFVVTVVFLALFGNLTWKGR